ncbi:tyrosine-protein phosphatase [Amycolatopsis thailandensis]|uniref:tyrosine-protein phosphatase n=1 Tax=Amycolatopsis thailandensis TaxID=589330 RepID=UPI00363694EA
MRGWLDAGLGGCLNGRDVGGLPTSDGERIRSGALLRSDSHSRLTTDGISAVRAVGISLILDLRWTREAAVDPSPFAGEPAYRNEPLIAELAEQGTTMPDAYRTMTDDNQRRITEVFVQLTDAPPGPLAVHCSAGRDRTGVLVALALSVAGVPSASIAADYALTEGCVGDTILRTLAHLNDRHGGVHAYLLKGGATHTQLRQVKDRLMASHGGDSGY